MADTERKPQELLNKVIKEREMKGLSICKKIYGYQPEEQNGPTYEVRIGDAKIRQVRNCFNR